MQNADKMPFAYGRAICYSGFREGQHPGGQCPSYDEIKEDLLILARDWKYLRLYDCDEHAETVLRVIREENLDFQVMQGAFIVAEMNNFGCPWGGTYPEDQLAANRIHKQKQIRKLIDLANQYPDIIFSLSAGNEACVDWTDHYVPVERVIDYVRQLKRGAKQPVTFCENYVPWLTKLEPLVKELDFISIHTYPVWEYKHLHEALSYTRDNYHAVASKYPEVPVIIAEAGWATNSNGRGIHPEHVGERQQSIYLNDLLNWVDQAQILTFVFEAFDEPWKGSPEPLEPEKHWGLYRVDRTPKRVIPELLKP
jgi:exo-beta-1,3-glucanase (GH17 family)